MKPMKSTGRQRTRKTASTTGPKAGRQATSRAPRLSGPSAGALHRKRGTQPATDKEFEEHFGDLPRDGEG